MSAARELGLEVGRDVSITGFDDIPLTELTNPTLTTVHQSPFEMGQLLGGMLMKIINKETIEERQIVATPTLVTRESTGSPLT